MNKIFAHGSALIVGSFLSVAAIAGVEGLGGPLEDEEKSTISSVVELAGGCTGWYIGDKRFVTAGHCAGDAKITLKTDVNTSIASEFVAISDPTFGMADWALIEANNDFITRSIKPLEIDCAYVAKAGDNIHLEGYPKDLGFMTVYGKVASNKVSKWKFWKKPMIRLNVAAIHGNSGSPVILEETGKVIGILVGGDAGGNPNLAIAQPLESFCKLIDYD